MQSKATHPLNPADRRDRIVWKFTQFVDSARLGIPHVHAVAETDAQDVLVAPVDEVEVEVISEVWSIEDFVWNFADCALLFSRLEEHCLAAALDRREAVNLGIGVHVYSTRSVERVWGWVGAGEVEESLARGSGGGTAARKAVIKNFGRKEGLEGFVCLVN